MEKASTILEAILIISSAFLLVLLGFLSVIVSYNKNRIKSIKDKQMFQQSILSAKIETQEQTFENISQELHDNIGQQLTALNFQLENQKLKQPESKESLDKISFTVSLIATQLQTLSRSLNTNWIQQQGLVEGIRKETERLQNISVLHFKFICPELYSLSLSSEKQIIIFRIFQEIINNALKHAQAKNIVIKLSMAQAFELSIMDDGLGFDIEEKMKSTAGMGLQNIASRARIIGFDSIIRSEIGRGTSFFLKENIPS